MFKSLHFICIYLHKIVMDCHKFATFATFANILISQVVWEIRGIQINVRALVKMNG